jgi:uncharacterized repeat protein (TIGR01451 family)
VTNTAAVFSAGQPDLNFPSEDSVTITPQSADLGVLKASSPSTPIAGRSITYTIVVTNAGPTAAKEVVVTDSLPPDVGLVSTSGACTEAAGQVTCTAATLASGGRLNYQVVITRGLAGSISNGVSVHSSTPDPVEGNDRFTLQGEIAPDVPAFLTFEQQPPAIAEAGVPFAPAVQVAIRDRFGNLVNTGDGNGDEIELRAYRNASCTTPINRVQRQPGYCARRDRAL